MNIIYNKIFLEHDTGMHPENRKRIESLGTIPESEISSGEKYLTLIHTPEYIERVKTACLKSERLDQDTVTSPRTYEAAVMAVGATVTASETGGFALVRPPGHHAHPGRAGGFCIFNNIAIAVKKLVDVGKRVLIFDFDGHLGDGTESIFYNTNQVLYWSIHQYPAYPGGGEADKIGKEAGKGYTINVPLLPGSGDDAYLAAVDTILPVVSQFAPDEIGFSAGFDGSRYDPLLGLKLSFNTYYNIGKLFHDLKIPVFAVLEGGYNTEALPKCFRNFVSGISGEPKPYTEEETDTKIPEMEQLKNTLQYLKGILSPYWKL